MHKDGLQNLEVLSEFLDLWFSVLKTQITQAKAGTASSKFDLRKMFEDANFEAYIEQLLKVTTEATPQNEELLFKVLCKSFRVLQTLMTSTYYFKENFSMRLLLAKFESKILKMIVSKTDYNEIILGIGLVEDLADMVFICSTDKIFATLRVLIRRLEMKHWPIAHFMDLVSTYMYIMQVFGQLDKDFLEDLLFKVGNIHQYSGTFLLNALNTFILCNYSDEANINTVLMALKSRDREFSYLIKQHDNAGKTHKILVSLHSILGHYSSDPRFSEYVSNNFKELIRISSTACVNKQFSLNLPINSNKFHPCTDFKSNYKLIRGRELRPLEALKDSESVVSPHETFLYNAMLKHFPDIVKNYSIGMYTNYPMCKYRIDFYLHIDSLDLSVAIELSGSYYTFVNGLDTGKARYKMDFIRSKGVVLVRLFNDSTLQHIRKILEYRRVAELVAFAIQLEIEKTKGFTLDLNFIS